jgi:hypothetical protein
MDEQKRNDNRVDVDRAESSAGRPPYAWTEKSYEDQAFSGLSCQDAELGT